MPVAHIPNYHQPHPGAAENSAESELPQIEVVNLMSSNTRPDGTPSTFINAPAFASVRQESLYPISSLNLSVPNLDFPTNSHSLECLATSAVSTTETLNALFEQLTLFSPLLKTIEPIALHGSKTLKWLRSYMPIDILDPTAALNEIIASYNEATTKLKDRLKTLNTLKNLQLSSTEVEKTIGEIEQALKAWRTCLNVVLAQKSAICEQLPAANYRLHPVWELPTQAPVLIELIDRITEKISTQQPLRMAIHIYQNQLNNAERTDISESEWIWLYELNQELISHHRAPWGPPNLSQALQALIRRGISPPLAPEKTIFLLENFLPIAIQEENIELTSSSEFTHLINKRPLSVTLENGTIFQEYQTLLDQYINYKNDPQTQKNLSKAVYLNILNEVYQRAQQYLPSDIEELQKQKETHPEQILKKRTLLDLKHFYDLAYRPLDQALSIEEKTTYTHLIATKQNQATREILSQQLAERLRLEQSYAIAEGNNSLAIADGHLLLLANGKAVIKGDTLDWHEINQTQRRDQLVLLDGAFNDYQALQKPETDTARTTTSELRYAARQCAAAKHQLKHLGIGLNTDTDTLHGYQANLLDKVEQDPAHFKQLFVQRSELLIKYQIALEILLEHLHNSPTLAKPLQEELIRTSSEQNLLQKIQQSTPRLTALERQLTRLQQTQIVQENSHTALLQLQRQEANLIQQTLAQFNLRFYQLRCQILEKNIAATAFFSKALQEAPPISQTALEEEFSTYLDVDQTPSLLSRSEKFQRLLNDKSIQTADLQRYRHWEEKRNNHAAKLADLKIEFREGLLALQKEAQRAKNDGGYPDQLNWSDWVKAKIPGDWFCQYRQTPQELVIAQQLALHGKNIREAYNDLFQTLKQLKIKPDFSEDFDIILAQHRELNQEQLQALGLTPKQLFAWARDYPTELQHLAGNLNHLSNILARPTFGTFGSEVAQMLRTSFERATIQNTVQDMLLGYRKDIPGILKPTLLPTPLIALLHAAHYAPYIGGALNGITEGSVGSRIGGTIGRLLPIPGADVLLKALAGAGQVQVEKDIAAKLNERREIEVTINALFSALGTQGGINERLKAMATYKSRRDMIKEAATIGRDFMETGPRGFFSRMRQQITLWWKYATPRNKLVMIGSAVVAPLLTSLAAVAFVVLTFGTAGIIPLAITAFIGAQGGLILLTSLWSFFSKRFGLEKTRERVMDAMTDYRIEQALNKLRENITPPDDTETNSTHHIQEKIAAAFAQECKALAEKLRVHLKKLRENNRGSSKLLPAQQAELNQMIAEVQQKNFPLRLAQIEKEGFDNWVNKALLFHANTRPSLPAAAASPPASSARLSAIEPTSIQLYFSKIAQEIDRQLTGPLPPTFS